MVKPSLKRQILEIIFKHIPRDKCAVFIFGSFAKKDIYPSSDIDIGLACARPLRDHALAKIKDGLGGLRTLRDIDLVDFSSCREKDFLASVLKEAKVWHQTAKSRYYFSNLKKRIKD